MNKRLAPDGEALSNNVLKLAVTPLACARVVSAAENNKATTE